MGTIKTGCSLCALLTGEVAQAVIFCFRVGGGMVERYRKSAMGYNQEIAPGLLMRCTMARKLQVDLQREPN